MSKTDLKQLNTVEWNEIDWRKVEKSVFKLQKRIYQASKDDNVRKLRRNVLKENKKSLSLIRYADDFLIIHENLDVIKTCQELIGQWLLEIGLELNQEKTKIAHTLNNYEDNKPGFDFLGFNIRQFPVGKYQSGKNTNGENLGFKTIIKPSKEKVKEHYRKLANIVDNLKAAPQHALISKLNPVIRGWYNYYRTVCSKETYSKMNQLLFYKLIKWGYQRHSNKSKTWSNNKYWHTIGMNNLVSCFGYLFYRFTRR